MTSVEPIVDVEHISFRYPRHAVGRPVLEDVSLRIEPRDFLGIIGPNGGGKTTLIKMMLGLLKPSQGKVRVFGQPPEAVRSRIGYVPQHAQIDPSTPASVLDVVLMGRLSRSPWGFRFGPDHAQAAMQALRQTGTDHLASRPIGSLSGGQRHRVLIARALVADAQLLLLDEPHTGVDTEAQRELIDLLHRLNERLPIVMVSHDVSFVSTHLKRVACLNHRIACHPAHEITDDVIAQMYHDHVAIHHEQTCPLGDPGCHDGCASPSMESVSDHSQNRGGAFRSDATSGEC